MAAPRTIAIDAMGGDHGPEVCIPGAALSIERYPEMSLILCGDGPRIEAALAAHPPLKARSRVLHTDTIVAMDEKPSQAMRRGKGTSMWLALEAVQKGEAHAAVSAGNTGALMALAMLCLRKLSGIDRPALAAIWPTIKGECIVLDVGANIGADARHLADLALMGAAMARAIFHIERPTVGLLNIGVEEMKGVEEVRQANAWLKQPELGAPLDYQGFVEGDQIGKGDVDVVVVEGFAGNIALKTAEGTARQIGHYLRSAMTRTLLTRLGALLAQGGFRALKDKMDPRRANGGTFMGVNGIVIKSHGGTDAIGFASAVDLGYEMAESNLLARLTADLAAFHGKLGEGTSKEAS